MNWNRALARPVPYKKPERGELRTLADARAYAIKRAAVAPGADAADGRAAFKCTRCGKVTSEAELRRLSMRRAPADDD